MFDLTLLPGGVRVAEKGLDAEGMEVVMAGELRAIVKGDGLPAVGGWSAMGRRCGSKAAGLRRPRLPLVWGCGHCVLIL